MAECSTCGALDVNNKLFDVISATGIVKVCSNCLSSDNISLNKPTDDDMQEVNKSSSVYERLSESAGIKDIKRHRQNVMGTPEHEALKKQEVSLRKIVDKTFAEKQASKAPAERRDDLVDNYHWLLMRARRNKKLTTSRLAIEIGVPEGLIKQAEAGEMPEGYEVAKKLENVLEIRIIKQEVAEMLENQRKQLGFDDSTSKDLTISDLKEMKGEDAPVVTDKTPYWRKVMSKIMGKKDQELPIEVEVTEIPEETPKPIQKREESVKETPVEFDDTSLEISMDISQPSTDEQVVSDIIKNEPKEEAFEPVDENVLDETPPAGKPKKEESNLSQEDIDDLIFGRK